MLPFANYRSVRTRPVGFGRLLLALCLACVGFASRAAAQPPGPAHPISGFPSCLPPVPEKPPRPPLGRESVPSFVDGLTSNDAAFEVVLGQGRILSLKENLTAPGKPPPLIAVGDPNVIDFVVVSPRQLRVVGKRLGVTDLSITTSDERTYTFEVRVVADLHVLRGQLQCLFPDARLKLGQVRDHVVVEGQARDTVQVNRILETIKAYLESIRISQLPTATNQLTNPAGAGGVGPGAGKPPGNPPKPDEAPKDKELEQTALQVPAPPPIVGPRPGAFDPGASQAGYSIVSDPVAAASRTVPEPRIINLIRVPGSQQVLLKVRVAELNRTGLREIGADLAWVNPESGTLVGTQIGGGTVNGSGIVGPAGGLLTNRDINRTFFDTAPTTTVFGIFEGSDFEILLRALRRNQLLKILAEPNLVAMSGHEANFLAGGEFPVPIPQTSTGGAGTSVTVTFKEFGVRLGVVLARSGRDAEALAEFRKGGCDDADAHTNLAFALILERRCAEAREHYQQALAAAPSSDRARRGLQELDAVAAKVAPESHERTASRPTAPAGPEEPAILPVIWKTAAPASRRAVGEAAEAPAPPRPADAEPREP